MATRALFLLLAAGLACGVIGAPVDELQPSAARLLVTAVVAVLAPLFWPGCAGTPAATVVRIVAWSVVAAAVAALLLLLVPGSAPQPPVRVAAACAMLLCLLLPVHALAGVLGSGAGPSGAEPAPAQSLHGTAIAFGLAGWLALPLWLGPVAELVSAHHPAAIDAVVGASPLTHLALASGNDWLRIQWFYQHSNLAALQVRYPGPAAAAWFYAALATTLVALGVLAIRHRRTRGGPHTLDPAKEYTA